MIPEIELKPGKFHVLVTEEDIRNGKREDATCCAIALALKRALGIDEVEVDGPHPTIGSYSTFVANCSNPDYINDFIVRFDQGVECLPFEFDLDLEYREYDGD